MCMYVCVSVYMYVMYRYDVALCMASLLQKVRLCAYVYVYVCVCVCTCVYVCVCV